VATPHARPFGPNLGGIVGQPAGAPLRARVELAVDRVIDQRYRIAGPLGMGGSSQVYRARDLTLGRDVAVKILDDRAAADGTLRRLFVKEGRALATLSHPNIVAVYDVGEVDGRPYIVMELVDGVSLKERIGRGGPLPVADAVRLLGQIAAGLAAAHARGIVHADLKPSNILLDRSDDAKICDFGVARTPKEDADTPQLYATAMYVAPERVEGRPATVASDVYGLGLVLYEMLVGRPPFTSTNASVLLRDHVVRQPVPPSHLRPSLPKEIDAVVLKALAKDPALRYRGVADVASALAHYHDGATGRIMAHPIDAFVPSATHSPVVALLSEHGEPIRRGFFSILTALPVFGLMNLAGFGVVGGILAAGLVAIIGLAGQLGIAVALAWIIETALIFIFVPGLAALFVLLGLVIWLRDVSAEQTAMAMAMPVVAPFGLAPALVLGAAAIRGIGGVATVAWGAVMTMIFAIASGRTVLGPFVQTGLSLQQDSLFGDIDAAQMKSAFLQALQPSAGADRFGPLLEQLDPSALWNESAGLVSRIAGADVSALATILAWITAALVVWTVTRLLRLFFDTLLRRRQWFALYVFATTIGVFAGAAVLYMLFVSTSSLALAPGRSADSVLFVSAFVGALLALAAGVVISATERTEHAEEASPSMAGRRIAVR